MKKRVETKNISSFLVIGFIAIFAIIFIVAFLSTISRQRMNGNSDESLFSIIGKPFDAFFKLFSNKIYMELEKPKSEAWDDCYGKPDGKRCNYVLEDYKNYKGVCIDGKCIDCKKQNDEPCEKDCEECKLDQFTKPMSAKCVEKNGKTGDGGCGFTFENGYTGRCSEGKCLHCNPPCHRDCGECKLFQEGYGTITAKCDTEGKEGKDCNYKRTGILSGYYEGICRDGECDCIKPCKDCETCETDIQFCNPDKKKEGIKCATDEKKPKIKDGICDGYGVCKRSPCDPPPTACQYCDLNAKPKPIAKADPSKNGNNCKTQDNKDGYCQDGTCKEKTCSNLNMPIVCGNTGYGLQCCKSDETCCDEKNGGGPKGTEVCCKNSNPKEKCSKGQGKSFCNPTVCKAPDKLCPEGGSSWSSCCKPEEVCVTFSFLGYTMGYCGKEKCDPKTEIKCGKGAGGEYCCKKDLEECKLNSGFPTCNTLKCEEDFHECSGSGEFNNKKICCKNGIEACGTHPGGYPRCLSVATKPGNPSKTKSLSAYMVRDKSYFKLNGIVYILSPHITFSDYVSVTLQTYDSSLYETYRFTDHAAVLGACKNSLLNSTSRMIDSSGGTVNIGDEIVLDIPKDALTNQSNITIEKYNLSNCYAIEKLNLPSQNIVLNDGFNQSESPGNKNIIQKNKDLSLLLLISIIIAFVVILIFIFVFLYARLTKHRK